MELVSSSFSFTAMAAAVMMAAAAFSGSPVASFASDPSYHVNVLVGSSGFGEYLNPKSLCLQQLYIMSVLYLIFHNQCISWFIYNVL